MRTISAVMMCVLVVGCGGSNESGGTPETQAAVAAAATVEGTPYPVASDPGAKYYLIELTGPATSRIMISKRVGKSGGLDTTNEFACGQNRDRQLGAGETREEMARNFNADREWSSSYVEGSITDTQRVLSCQNL